MTEAIDRNPVAEAYQAFRDSPEVAKVLDQPMTIDRRPFAGRIREAELFRGFIGRRDLRLGIDSLPEAVTAVLNRDLDEGDPRGERRHREAISALFQATEIPTHIADVVISGLR